MNKNIKHILAFTLPIGVFLAIESSKYDDLFTISAYAFSSIADKLTDITLKSSDGDTISIYKDGSCEDELTDQLEDGTTYYAKTSADRVLLNIAGTDENYVRIFKDDKIYEVGESMRILSDSTTTLKVRVYYEEYNGDKNYSSSDYNQYTIKVINSDDDVSDSNVKLSGISLSEGSIDFNKDSKTYNVNVNPSTSSIAIKATPLDDESTVKVAESTVTKNDNYTKVVSLCSESTTVRIKVIDENITKTYTLNINKTAMNNQQKSLNGWNQINGQWYYYNNGQMKIGWFKDIDGKWYYLQSNGVMAKNTIIDGYKVGQDGAWIQ